VTAACDQVGFAVLIERTLRLLHEPGSTIEARILVPSKIYAGYFTDHAALAEAISGFDGKANIYTTLNTLAPSLADRVTNDLRKSRSALTRDADIVARRWLMLDVDTRRDKPASDAEVTDVLGRRDEIVSWLLDQGWPEPIRAMSGNGGHALWRVDLANSPPTTKLFSQTLKTLGQRFPSDRIAQVDEGVYNASRIWKLYGTTAVKGTATAERPHRRAEIQTAPARLDLLTEEQIAAVARQYKRKGRTRTESTPLVGTGSWAGRRWDGDLVRVFRLAGAYLRELEGNKHSVVCPWSAEHTDAPRGEYDTSAAIFELSEPGNRWGFKCQHAHCAGRSIKDVYAHFNLGRRMNNLSHNTAMTRRRTQHGQENNLTTTVMSEVTSPVTIQDLRAIVEGQFPGYWPAVTAGLATTATVLLKGANPTAMIYVGGPSCGKTTVANFFSRAEVVVADGDITHELFYRSDGFTPAAFVSQAANVAKKDLDNVDLLPRIKNKVLVTVELAPIFRGKDDDLTKTFAVITRVLDGQGLQTDSGTHGRRGYDGEYLFGWIGCTTPFRGNVWRIMGQLGSRLFFFPMDEGRDVTVADLVDGDSGPRYAERLAICSHAVGSFLSRLFEEHGGVRSVRWDADGDPREVKKWIAKFATALARLRSEPVRESEFGEYIAEKTEQPRRAYAVLSNLARAHAVLYGRTTLTDADLRLVASVAIGTMPTSRRRVFRALMLQEHRLMTVSDVMAVLGVTAEETAKKVMEDMDALGVVGFTREGGARPRSSRSPRTSPGPHPPGLEATSTPNLLVTRGCVRYLLSLTLSNVRQKEKRIKRWCWGAVKSSGG
jgi:hypothetical protein